MLAYLENKEASFFQTLPLTQLSSLVEMRGLSDSSINRANMNPMQTAEQQLDLALQQNDAQQRMIEHISERLAAMEEAGKIGDEKVLLLTNQLHLADSVLANVTALAEAQKTRPNSSRYKAANPTPFSGLPDTLLPRIHQVATHLHLAEIV
jgi:hypothetical protein